MASWRHGAGAEWRNIINNLYLYSAWLIFSIWREILHLGPQCCNGEKACESLAAGYHLCQAG